jgi:chromosome partitioning protein
MTVWFADTRRTPVTAPAQQGGPLPRYAVWNNKGGVGKTFLTFTLAAEYATKYPGRNVVVIDMCPQANVSEILLGGNGAGASNLDKLLAVLPYRRTIGGYFDARITQPHARTGTEISWLLQASKYNSNVPANLFLVAGDPSLELQTQAMNQIAAQTLPANTWQTVHSWLLDMVTSISTGLPQAVFFIDCNPSFAAYTELALLAATRLIIPCSADGSSARAIDNVGRLVYGINVPSTYASVDFAQRANQAGMALPTIHVVPLNRSTQYDNRASRAFGAMYDEIRDRVSSLRTQIARYFSMASADPFYDIPDAHTVAIVASHFGMPLSAITATRYDIFDVEARVNEEPLNRYRTAVDGLIELL